MRNQRGESGGVRVYCAGFGCILKRVEGAVMGS